ncbi:hypothetical protein NQD34_013069, partial [Periophthalmus magnuspinnatus]
MPVRKKDAQRALVLLQEYRAKLQHTEERALRLSIQRVIDIFQSNLFQALIDIQEFYEVTLLDSQRWTESGKEAEPMPPVHLWDSPSITSDTLALSTSLQVPPPMGAHNTRQHTLIYGQQDEDTPQDPTPPPLPEDSPELVQVSQKSLSQVETVHGYVSHAHISPIKVLRSSP